MPKKLRDKLQFVFLKRGLNLTEHH